MNQDEKNRLALERELEELRKVAEGFAAITAEARRQTQELEAAFRRLDSIRAEIELDRKIDELDYLMGRGRYADTIVEAALRASSAGDLPWTDDIRRERFETRVDGEPGAVLPFPSHHIRRD